MSSPNCHLNLLLQFRIAILDQVAVLYGTFVRRSGPFDEQDIAIHTVLGLLVDLGSSGYPLLQRIQPRNGSLHLLNLHVCVGRGLPARVQRIAGLTEALKAPHQVLSRCNSFRFR